MNIIAENGSKIKLHNILGILVKEEILTNHHVQLDVSGSLKGIYIIEINNGKTVNIGKVII